MPWFCPMLEFSPLFTKCDQGDDVLLIFAIRCKGVFVLTCAILSISSYKPNIHLLDYFIDPCYAIPTI
ncbi:predicted protein [Sclerotinia sclerotiorum 1980 UF-70]|uniref:Uncharacterized protein n=1 Tax=Sclerotinia sclerotiorum (strain ATCC 18683 / 1980 / Ss-1) TaxID=665079 RepID=A7EQ36_SCLS1|nr:predicted protein [Sclerotinia sclerotiorum 1980 UF-70]EDO04952.1 predicted protein [Sclerotinia sclerotiorum 1980 UF-70]